MLDDLLAVVTVASRAYSSVGKLDCVSVDKMVEMLVVHWVARSAATKGYWKVDVMVELLALHLVSSLVDDLVVCSVYALVEMMA